MPKHILLALTAAILFCTPTFAQDAPLETSIELGGTYSNSITLNDSGSTLTLDDVKTVDLGLRAEREFARRDNLTLSGALSAQARFGEGNASRLNGLKQTDDVNYRSLGGYADMIARVEGQDESDWTPFLSIGAGVVHDRVSLDGQVFKDISPVGRVRAGLEKKIYDKATFAFGVGLSSKLD